MRRCLYLWGVMWAEREVVGERRSGWGRIYKHSGWSVMRGGQVRHQDIKFGACKRGRFKSRQKAVRVLQLLHRWHQQLPPAKEISVSGAKKSGSPQSRPAVVVNEGLFLSGCGTQRRKPCWCWCRCGQRGGFRLRVQCCGSPPLSQRSGSER